MWITTHSKSTPKFAIIFGYVNRFSVGQWPMTLRAKCLFHCYVFCSVSFLQKNKTHLFLAASGRWHYVQGAFFIVMFFARYRSCRKIKHISSLRPVADDTTCKMHILSLPLHPRYRIYNIDIPRHVIPRPVRKLVVGIPVLCGGLPRACGPRNDRL